MARAPAIQDAEPVPEIDRLEGIPHPRETTDLYGHEAAEAELAAAIGSDRTHHAWLLAGPSGIGKATLAYRVAKFAFAADDERDIFGTSLAVGAETIAARQVRALSHPGLLLLRRSYNLKDKRFPASISVDEVRRLRSFLSMSAAAGSWRVVIVDSADELNINAANALLKSLEEPPRRTLFLLVTSEPGRLLATIRSRCRTLDMKRLGEAYLRRAVGQAIRSGGGVVTVPDEGAWPLLLRLADGSVGRALSLTGVGGIDLYNEVFALVASLPTPRWPGVHKLADNLAAPAAEARFTLFFELLLDLVARLVRAQATGAGEAREIELAARLVGEARLASMAGLWETVAREKAETVALNLDRKTLILKTVSRLETATR
ncbi:MAG: DNA polymerase III subunit delta' [Hyphomicrobiaceae bacterium]|nr:DNA polymerase III subunit delta' [Hyphomicrobiaceae bacterium]